MSTDEGAGVGLILAPSSLVPDGKYEVRYRYYETQICFGASKVAVHFAIVNHDTYGGTPISRHYTVESLRGPPKRFGDFTIKSPNCSLVREFGRASKNPDRRDRISYASFKDKRILVKTRTVIRNSRDEELAKDERYSVVAQILCVIDDQVV